MAELIIRFPGRPPVHNQVRRQHWAVAEKMTDHYQSDAIWFCRGRDPLTPPVEVCAQPTTKSATLPDAGACFDAVKAAVDGIVKAKIIPDDSPQFVVRIVFEAPVQTGEDSLIIQVKEVEA